MKKFYLESEGNQDSIWNVDVFIGWCVTVKLVELAGEISLVIGGENLRGF